MIYRKAKSIDSEYISKLDEITGEIKFITIIENFQTMFQ